MSKLDDLLKQYCPDGVEYKRLDSVVKIKNGRDYKSFSSGDIPVYGSGGIMTYINNYAYDKSSVLIPRKGSLGNILYVDTPFWTVDTMFYTEINTLYVHPRFLYHVLLNAHLEKMNLAGGVPSLTQSQLNALSIPVPPLIVQNEIVRILDSFTELTAELAAELTARRAQYEYYRDKLLSFDDETAIVKRIKDMLDQTCGGADKVEYKRLGDVGTFRRGGNFQKKEMTLEGIPCIHYGQIYMHYGLAATGTISYLPEPIACNQKKAEPGEIIVAITSENVEDVCKAVVWEGDSSVCVSGHTAVFNTAMNPRFIAYWFQTEMFQSQKRKYAHGVKVIEISPDQIAQCMVPCPSRQIQDAIVSILDKFNTLTTDIFTGLPAEISLRQKQYEHYRDRLLNFNGGGIT